MIIVTGGAGFIGSNLVKKLNEIGETDILIVDRLGSSLKWKNLIGKKYSDFVHKDDFTLALNQDAMPSDIQAIFHLGACTDTTERNSDYLMENNFLFSRELAFFAATEQIRFIYASSAATYGNGDSGYSDYKFDDLRPLNMYGYSKHLFDEWVIANGFENSFTGFKFFNVFGPNEYHKNEMASMVYKSFNQIKAAGQVKLFKSNSPEIDDGEQKRDFIYVKDVVNNLIAAYQNDDLRGIYNLGSGRASSWNELIGAVFAAMGIEKNIEYIDMPESLKSQYQNFTQADMSKLQTALGSELFFTSLLDAVKDYVQNYLMTDWIYN